MAILINTELFQCNCGCMEFQIETYKSFCIGKKITDQTMIYENTSRDVLKCIQCGQKYDPKNEKIIIKTIEE